MCRAEKRFEKVSLMFLILSLLFISLTNKDIENQMLRNLLLYLVGVIMKKNTRMNIILTSTKDTMKSKRLREAIFRVY